MSPQWGGSLPFCLLTAQMPPFAPPLHRNDHIGIIGMVLGILLCSPFLLPLPPPPPRPPPFLIRSLWVKKHSLDKELDCLLKFWWGNTYIFLGMCIFLIRERQNLQKQTKDFIDVFCREHCTDQYETTSGFDVKRVVDIFSRLKNKMFPWTINRCNVVSFVFLLIRTQSLVLQNVPEHSIRSENK